VSLVLKFHIVIFWLVMLQTDFCTFFFSFGHSYNLISDYLFRKNSQNCFCWNFFKFSPTLIILGTKMAKTTE